MLQNLMAENSRKPPEKRKRTSENEKVSYYQIPRNGDNNVSSLQSTNPDKNDKQKSDVWNYGLNDLGPYMVFIKKKERSTRPNSVLHICRMMKKLKYNYKTISNDNKWTSRIIFESKHTANAFLADERVSNEHGYRAFLTQELLFRKIVVRDIPTDITSDELKNEMIIDQGKIVIQDIYRLKRKNQMKELVPTESVCVTIRSHDLPRDVVMWNAKLSFLPYIQGIRQCYKCGKLNHSTKFCKALESTCLKCGKPIHGECQDTLKCINCGGPHKSLDYTCIKVQEAREINKIRAYDNVSYFEAKNILKKYQQAPVAPVKTKESFPPLKEKPNEHKNVNYKSTLIDQNQSRWNNPLNMVNTNKDNVLNNNDKIHLKEQMAELTNAMDTVPDAVLLMSRLWKTVTQHIKIFEATEENKKNETLNVQNATIKNATPPVNTLIKQIHSTPSTSSINKPDTSVVSTVKPQTTSDKLFKTYQRKIKNMVNKSQSQPSEVNTMELPESDESNT